VNYRKIPKSIGYLGVGSKVEEYMKWVFQRGGVFERVAEKAGEVVV